MDELAKPSLRGEATRDALLDAATLVFARAGFGPANLREIAQAAEVNQALIGYHFHSKEGLYQAVFERMVAQIQAAMEPVTTRLDAVLREPVVACPPGERNGRYLEPLLLFMEGLLTHMVHEHPAWGELFVRETQAPTAAFEILFDGLIRQGLGRMEGLLQRIRPNEEPLQIRLLAATIVSQVIVIRISRPVLMRFMNWETITGPQLDTMKALIRRNTTLLALGD